MDAAAGTANSKVLTNPFEAPALVASSNQVADSILSFNGVLGIHRQREALEARRWKGAAAEVKDKALEKSAERLGAAKQTGRRAVGKTKSATGKVSSRIAERAKRLRGSDADGPTATE